MELDNLKQAWKEQAIDPPQTGEEQILSMLRKKSQSPIARIKRNLRWELIAVLILYISTIVYYLSANHGRYWELALLLFIVGAVFVFYYYQKNKLLNQMECVSCEVRSNLLRQVTTLEKYIRFYFLAGVIITPICYFITGIIVASKAKFSMTKNPGFFLWFVGTGVVLTIILYFVNIWYVNRLYGQHVKKLKTLLRETEETI